MFPTWVEFQPFLVIGLAQGGVYALSGVGMVVLYRATGVLNLSFGAVGAMGALIAWQGTNGWGLSEGVSWLLCVAFAAVITLVYGMIFGVALADRDPLVKATATLGFALLLLGVMSLLWTTSGGAARAITLPTDDSGFNIGTIHATWTQVIGLWGGIVMAIGTGLFLRRTKLGTAMRAMATDREITSMLGVPVNRVLALAWFGCGVLAGIAGLLLADLVALDPTTLTFLVISSVAAALIARLRSIAVTCIAAIVIGLVDSMATPILQITNYRDMAPFVLATIALVAFSSTSRISLDREGI